MTRLLRVYHLAGGGTRGGGGIGRRGRARGPGLPGQRRHTLIYIYYYPQTIFPDTKNKKVPHLIVTYFYHSFHSPVTKQQKDPTKKDL